MGSTLELFFATCPGMLFIAEADGVLRHSSRALERRFAHRLGETPSLAALADGEPGLDAWLATLAGDEPGTEHTLALCTSEADGSSLLLRCAVQRDAEGLLHGLLEVDETMMSRVERALLRALYEQLELVVWAVDDQGVFLIQDGKAMAQAGLEPGQFIGMNLFDIYPKEVSDPARLALEGGRSHSLNEVHGVHWESWNVPLKMFDGKTYCAGITLNVSERVRTQRNLEQQLDTIQRQQQAIFEISTPILNVWDKVLAIPLVGAMDSQRAGELSERLLAAAQRSQTRFVIVDLTGVEVVDSAIAAHILDLLAALRLLGVEGMVTGVSPEVARTMVGVGVDFANVQTHRSLKEGLRHCMFEFVGTPA